jgi:hypothetical protein
MMHGVEFSLARLRACCLVIQVTLVTYIPAIVRLGLTGRYGTVVLLVLDVLGIGELMGSGNVRGRKFSLGAGVTFALAAVSGVAGGRLTSHITPALVVFVGVVAAGMIMTYWVDRRRGITGDIPERAISGKPGMATVDGGHRSVQFVIAEGPGSSAIATMHGNTYVHGPEDQAVSGPLEHLPGGMEGGR